MSTNRLEGTGKVGPDKEGMHISSALDLNELSDEELKRVSGGVVPFYPLGYGYMAWLHATYPSLTQQQIFAAAKRMSSW